MLGGTASARRSSGRTPSPTWSWMWPIWPRSTWARSTSSGWHARAAWTCGRRVRPSAPASCSARRCRPGARKSSEIRATLRRCMRLLLLLGIVLGTLLLVSVSPAGAALDVVLEPEPAPALDLLAPVAIALSSLRVEPLPAPEPEPFALVWPADGELTDGFGPRWGRPHTGIDVGILRRLRVVAAAPGRGEATRDLPGYAGSRHAVVIIH